MTREEICQRLGWMTLPKQSEMLGQTQHSDLLDRIEEIVEAAVAAEREACEKVASDYWCPKSGGKPHDLLAAV